MQSCDRVSISSQRLPRLHTVLTHARDARGGQHDAYAGHKYDTLYGCKECEKTWLGVVVYYIGSPAAILVES